MLNCASPRLDSLKRAIFEVHDNNGTIIPLYMTQFSYNKFLSAVLERFTHRPSNRYVMYYLDENQHSCLLTEHTWKDCTETLRRAVQGPARGFGIIKMRVKIEWLVKFEGSQETDICDTRIVNPYVHRTLRTCACVLDEMSKSTLRFSMTTMVQSFLYSRTHQICDLFNQLEKRFGVPAGLQGPIVLGAEAKQALYKVLVVCADSLEDIQDEAATRLCDELRRTADNKEVTQTLISALAKFWRFWERNSANANGLSYAAMQPLAKHIAERWHFLVKCFDLCGGLTHNGWSCDGCGMFPVIGKCHVSRAAANPGGCLCDVCYATITDPHEKESFFALAVPMSQWRGVDCDGCEMKDMLGPRFKCVQCCDYDLCIECMSKARQIHGDHSFRLMMGHVDRIECHETNNVTEDMYASNEGDEDERNCVETSNTTEKDEVTAASDDKPSNDGKSEVVPRLECSGVNYFHSWNDWAKTLILRHSSEAAKHEVYGGDDNLEEWDEWARMVILNHGNETCKPEVCDEHDYFEDWKDLAGLRETADEEADEYFQQWNEWARAIILLHADETSKEPQMHKAADSMPASCKDVLLEFDELTALSPAKSAELCAAAEVEISLTTVDLANAVLSLDDANEEPSIPPFDEDEWKDAAIV